MPCEREGQFTVQVGSNVAVVARASASCGATTRGSRSARRLSERRDSPISWNLSLDEQAALDGFETLSPNGRPLGAEDFIAMVETKLGRKVRPAKRGESHTEGGWIDMGNS